MDSIYWIVSWCLWHGTRSHVDMECSNCWPGFPFCQRRTCGGPMCWRLHESCSLTTKFETLDNAVYGSTPLAPQRFTTRSIFGLCHPFDFMHSPALRGIPTSFSLSFFHLRYAQVGCTVKQALSLALGHLTPRPNLTALLFQLVCLRP